MSVEQAAGALPTVEKSVKEKVDFFEKEIGRMSQQEEHHRGTRSEDRSESEQKLESTQDEDTEQLAISSNGHSDAAVGVGNQGTQSGKGQGTGTMMYEDAKDLVGAQAPDNIATTAVPVGVSGLVDAESTLPENQSVTPTQSKSSPAAQKRPQTASPSAVRPLSASQDFTGSQTVTVPEPFRFSLDSRPRRSSDGGVQTPPDAAKRRPRSSSHTFGSSPKDLKVVSSTGRKAQTTPQPFNLEGLKRHERALEQLKADIAAKEAEETAPRSFKARPILKPDVAPSPRVVPPPTKPSAFKLSVEDRAERRDKFKKQVEDRERQLEGEREKMLQELKKEVDKEEKQVRRSASFKATPAKLTPDAKVFKPTLGQSPRTTPRAPVLGPKRRHSTGSEDGSTTATSDKGPSATPGAASGTSQPSSRPASKPASPLTGKPPSPRVNRTASPGPPRPSSAGLAKAASPRPVKPASPSSVKTPSPRLSKPATPSPKPSPTPAKAVTPRLTKPAPLRTGSPRVGKTPSPMSKKAPGQGGSTPASPRPAGTAVAKVSTRRSSDTSGAAGKPSSPAAAMASPSGASSQAGVVTRQGSRPLSASKAGVTSPGTPGTPTSRRVASPRTASTLSPRGVARPVSASAAKSRLSPGAKVTPSKVLHPKVTREAAADEKQQTGGTITSSTPAEMAGTGTTDDKAAKLGADSTANGDEPSKEPPARSEMSADPNEEPQGGESASERAQLEVEANTSEVTVDALVPAEVEPKDSVLAKVEANGLALLDADERRDEEMSVQQGHAL
ncbi:hypothetical protein KFL_004170040 [Klebsormidium nitens]|uniref:TPX2 C-terminal domain-containing protein n=1 Tax=Klebsormidium nitens TaxID=105231 RepID=A0A1Y1IHW1_KLENI|nr:hypothetical protein KFL_004170040 [Klebsormidium nitens]|eukprot:GAQ88306.1 hypothetical protein KFL_004170040 [Klebsormidium nitens]